MRGDETLLYKISEACNILGVKESTLRKWGDSGKIKCIKTPGGMRLFDLSSVNPALKTDRKNINILYSRVSSAKQKDDLERQKLFLRNNLPDQYSREKFDHVSDIGSGINFKRPGLLQVLGLVKEGKVSTLVVASRDRLARFGFELIEWLCSEFGTKILVLDSEDTTPESELSKDLMAIVQVYCCRWNGKRRYSNTKDKVQKTEAETKSGTKEVIEPVGRVP
jgi:excisionase family DNA binding protein